MGAVASTAWDTYAFGVILFRLASGELPFKGTTNVAMAMARVSKPAIALSKIVPNVNPALAAVVARCLEREPRQRLANIDGIRSALRAMRFHEPQRRSAPRTRMTMALLATVGVALVTIMAFRLAQRSANAKVPTVIRQVAAMPRVNVHLEPRPQAKSPADGPADSRPLPSNEQISREAKPTPTGKTVQQKVPAHSGNPQVITVRTVLSATTATATTMSVTSEGPAATSGEDDVVIPSFARPKKPRPSSGAP